MNVGIQLASLRQPFKKALHTAAALGAPAVEIDARNEIWVRELSRTGLRHLKKMLDDLNLRICAVGFHTRRGYNVLQDLDRRVAATKSALRLSHQLGADVLVNQVGTVPAESEGQEWSLLVDVLSDLGAYGQQIGACLAVETGTESATDLKRLLAALPSGLVAVDLNPGNLVINGFSAQDAVEQLGPEIRHVHATDAVRDLAQGRGVEVPLGQGAVDFPELLGALEEHQYRGFFTVGRGSSDVPGQEIQQAVQYLKDL